MKNAILIPLLILMLGVPGLLRADEIGPATCGHAFRISGIISHYPSDEGYTVENATDPAMYTDEVYGLSFQALVPGLPAGNYTLEIFLAESYHSSAGQRIFSIQYGNEAIASDLDIFEEVGKDSEYKISHPLSFSPAGEEDVFSIAFSTSKDHAKFNAIRLRDANDSLVACVMASELVPVMEHNGNGNPFIQHMFTADPSAHVFEDRVYVYPSHDLNNSDWFNMRDYHVFSSSDLLNWTDHGVALDVDDVPWATEYMWAPDCAYKDSTYFFYFPAKDSAGEFRIGVATSRNPAGPFTPEAEPIEGSFSVDPAVFIDDDGQAYMYFGGAGHGGQENAWVARLDSSMKAFSEAPVELKGISYWFEACWVHKLDGIYYMSYSTGSNHPQHSSSSAIAWATATDPMGPFTYQGVVNGTVSGWTNHHSTVEYKNQWYLFYHNSDLSGGNTSRRSICADYLHFNEDGSMRLVEQTLRGIGSYEGTLRVEAENYSATGGAHKQETDEGGLCMVLEPGDSLVYRHVELTGEVLDAFIFTYSSSSREAILEVNLNNDIHPPYDVGPLDGSSKWIEDWTPISLRPDTVDLVLKYKGPAGSQLKLDQFMFTKQTGVSESDTDNLQIYPNPASEFIQVKTTNGKSPSMAQIYNASGSRIRSEAIPDGRVDVRNLVPGMYHLILSDSNGQIRHSEKVLIQ